MGILFFFGDRVLHMEDEVVGFNTQPDGEGDIADIVLYPMFEAVFQEQDEDHGRDVYLIYKTRPGKGNGKTLAKAKLLDVQVVLQVVYFFRQRYQRNIGFIEHIAHEVG